MLAGCMARHQDKLRADFQRYYGLNLDGMGTDYTVFHAADLAANLPRDAATTRAVNPAASWDDATYLLAYIEYDLRVLAWQNTKDGQKGRKQPKPMQTPADIARVADKMQRTDMDAIADALGIDVGGDSDG